MKRRDALKRIGTMAGAAVAAPSVLSACRFADDSRPPVGITTIVTVMMENRSFDHWLGARALLEGRPEDGLTAGLSNPDLSGQPIEIFHDLESCVADPPHGWDSSRAQVAGGDNSGFLQAYQNRVGTAISPHVMGYLTREQLPFTWALADGGAVCDRWFSSVLGPTLPNRGYLHSGQSGGNMDNDLGGGGGWDWPHLYGQLDAAGVDWAYYFSDLPVVALFRELQADGRIKRADLHFFEDAANGELPPVVFIDPPFGTSDDHPPHHPMLGQQFLASVYAALAGSPQWNNIMLVVTYDEHGGFYDHVAPPTAPDDRAALGFDQLGIRVPTVIAGPYVKQGHVSSVVRDHTSVLAHIHGMLELAPLTARDAAAADLSEVLDLDRLAAGEPAPPPAVPAIEIDESQIADECFGARATGPVGIAVDLGRAVDLGYIDRRFDRRGDARDIVYAIGDRLDALGGGRIRRGR